MRAEVQRYYGEVLQSSADLKTDACCTEAAPPDYLKRVLAQIHDEVMTRYYGCGLVLPEALEGTRILDLGCGAGRDVYALSQLVGEHGQVVGVDMTAAQLEVAKRHRDYHAREFGYARPNVEFIEGDIEHLEATGLADDSFDIIVSNCVINLAGDKRAVLDQAWRLLRPGGELYFADVYADRRIPAELQSDPVLYGECLSGALYWNDFLQLAGAAGFGDPRLVTDRPISVDDTRLAARVGNIRFFSATYRLFKLAGLEASCEDYGQAVRYRGGIAHAPDAFELDQHHRFERGKLVPVCGNTWRMLAETRFASAFEFYGDSATHYGIFDGCGESLPFSAGAGAGPEACC
jgi:SAM-dependent methyltransferase